MLTLTGVGQPQNGNLISDLLLALCARATYCENKTCSKDTLNEIKNVPFSPYVPVPFTISVKTDNAGTSSTDQFTIPWTGTYDVDWGDGNTDTGVTNAQTHTYATAGTYDVSVTAASGRIAFANGGDKLKLLNISSWGETAWTQMGAAFRGCSNLTVLTATDTPDLSNVTQMNYMFMGCLSFNSPINNWNVSNVIDMVSMFEDAFVFNQDLDLWDVSNVVYMTHMFLNAKVFNGNITTWNVGNVLSFISFLNNWRVQSGTFNQDLSSWNVSSAINMQGMFSYQSSFNQDITSWNVSSVTNMSVMFAYSGLNQPIGTWNVSNVTDINQMFEKSAFDQSLSAWNTSNVTNMGRIFNNISKVRNNIDVSGWDVSQVTSLFFFANGTTLSTANYDALLIAWDAQGAMSYSGTVPFGNSVYTLGGAAEAARTSLISKWGAITDGGGITPLTTNLVASYSFDTDFTDYTGNNDLTAFGNVVAGVAGGVVDDCAEFDGNADYTLAADSDDFSFTDGATDLPFSVSFWANFDTFTNLVFVFSKRSTVSSAEYNIAIDSNSFIMSLASQGGFSSYLNANFPYTPTTGGTTWEHFTVTYDGSETFGGFTMYLNGVSQTLTDGTVGTYLGMANGTHPINIGSAGWQPSTYEFDGKMDEFHVWKNRELTSAEVLNIYTTELSGTSILPPAPPPSPFIISVKTDNAGTSNDDQFTLPWTGTYDVDWGDGNIDTSVVDAQTHTYATAGTYDVSVTAASGQLNFNNTGDKAKLLDISSWGDCTWTSVIGMFYGCSNLATISATDSPDLSAVTVITQMFRSCTILDCDINHWDVSTLTGAALTNTFNNARAFNSPLNNWDVSGVNNLYSTFLDARSFNQPLNNAWNQSYVGNMYYTFRNALLFDQDLSSWDMSNAANMFGMFQNSSISGGLSNWNIGNATSIGRMFMYTNYNEDISGWDVSSVTDMYGMFFSNPSFNQDISSWDVSNVTNMAAMFQSATSFNQDISGWQISQVVAFNNFMVGVTLSTTNYDALLIAWDAQGAMSYSGTVSFGNSQYTSGGAAEAARTSLISKWGAITDGGGIAPPPVPFTISVKTDNAGTSNSDQFTIPTTGTGYNYEVNTSDGQTITGNTGDTTITFPSAGTYDVEISGDFPRIYFARTGDKSKLLDIKQWGNYPWDSMLQAFEGCDNLTTITATDILNSSALSDYNSMFYVCPNLLSVTNMNSWDMSGATSLARMFSYTNSFNQDLNNWDVSGVTSVNEMFRNASSFNGNIDNWNLSNCNNFFYCFREANSFNRNIGGWTLSSVGTPINFTSMFYSNSSFNNGGSSSINNWDMSNASGFANMFYNCDLFDQNISGWDITNINANSTGNFKGATPGFSTANYDAILIGWESQSPPTAQSPNFGSSQYTSGGAAETARTSLINTYGWTITDGGAAPVPLTTNLVASYSFDTDFSDYTGNNNLTVTGNVLAGVTGGVVDDCADFDGTSDYTVAADSDDFSFTDGVTDLPFSISFWINFNNFDGDATFLSKRDGSGLEYQMAFLTAGIQFILFSQGSASAYLFPSTPFTPTTGGLTWQHFTFTYDGSGTFAGIKCYIDSVIQTSTNGSSGTYVGMLNTASPINIGSKSWSPGLGEVDGKMDEYHIWKNRELTQAEVTDIYTTELGGTSILPAATGLLADYPNASAAYSLRNLISTTTNVVRVRRNNDQAEQNFTSAEITDGTLTTWTGANDGFVTTWYDQSGNLNNAVQATATNQARLVLSGVVELENGKPAAKFYSSIGYDLTPFNANSSGSYSYLVGAREISLNRFMGFGGTQYLLALWNDNNYYFQPQSNGYYSSNATDTTTSQMLLTGAYNGTDGEIFKNSSLVPSSFVASSLGISVQYFGKYSSVHTSNGNIQEAVFWNTDQSANRSGIETNINTEYTIY